MTELRTRALDQVWFWFVLIHIAGSAVLAILLGIHYGTVLAGSLPWIYCAWANRRARAGIFLSAVGWSVTMYFLYHMPVAYRISFLMNLLLLTGILFLYYGSIRLMGQESRIGMISWKDLILILAFTFLFLIIGEYVNAVSMLVFRNYVTDSLADIRLNLWSGILVFAAAPALVEEIMFRGFIFSRLGNGRKSILVSALLFSLGHMNFNQICYAFIMGILFALIFHCTDNLTFTLLIHFLFNLYSVVLSAFADSPLTDRLAAFGILGYQPFFPVLKNETGNVMATAMAAGTGVALCAVLLVVFLLGYLRKRKGTVIHREGAEPDWKPGLPFFAGIGLCLIVAVTREIL